MTQAKKTKSAQRRLIAAFSVLQAEIEMPVAICNVAVNLLYL